jgi:hypothetical protein
LTVFWHFHWLCPAHIENVLVYPDWRMFLQDALETFLTRQEPHGHKQGHFLLADVETSLNNNMDVISVWQH